MRQRGNVKSEREEITIILFEHGKVLCQVESERNIELSFRNTVLIKANLFRKKYRRIFGYAIFENASEKSRNIEERFRPFARPGRL